MAIFEWFLLEQCIVWVGNIMTPDVLDDSDLSFFDTQQSLNFCSRKSEMKHANEPSWPETTCRMVRCGSFRGWYLPWELTWLAGISTMNEDIFLSKMGNFQCHVSFPGCISLFWSCRQCFVLRMVWKPLGYLFSILKYMKINYWEQGSQSYAACDTKEMAKHSIHFFQTNGLMKIPY